MLTPWKLLLCQMAMNIFYHVVKGKHHHDQLLKTFLLFYRNCYYNDKSSIFLIASLCLGGQDIIAAVRENSPTGEFVANINIEGNPGTTPVRLCLTGQNADWFFLEGKSIRLNSSYTRGLDREVRVIDLQVKHNIYTL